MSGFADLRLNRGAGRTDESFWPSFTDVMAVVTMIFLITTSFLIVRNFELLRQITTAAEAERMAAELARTANEENATLEEQLADAQHTISMLRLQALRSTEQTQDLQQRLREAEQALVAVRARAAELGSALEQSRGVQDRQQGQIADLQIALDNLETERERLQQILADAERYRQALERNLAEIQVQRQALERELNSARDQGEQLQARIGGLQQDRDQLRNLLAESREQLGASPEIELRQQGEIDRLQQRTDEFEQRFGSLQGEYDDLRIRYDRLIRPARTAAGKYVVEVRYRLAGDGGREIQFRHGNLAEFQTLDKAGLESELDALKQRYPDQLYVKIIFPENSGLTYTEAWSFTTELLRKYDYYYQDPANQP